MNMHYKHKGGIYGYCSRRILHMGMVFIPLIYYWYGQTLGNVFNLSRNRLLAVILLFIACFEGLRIKCGWIILGQREYESKQISAFAWGALGVTIVLLMVPKIGIMGAALGFPIIASLALVDPLLGEIRRWNNKKFLVVGAGLIVTSLVWVCSIYWLQTPWWLIFFVVPVTLAAELYKVPKIDDNFTMLIAPLILVLILYYFGCF